MMNMKKSVLFAVLLSFVGGAFAAKPVTIRVLSTDGAVTISDDGRYTYLDLGKKATEYPAVFARGPLDQKQLRAFVVLEDGRLRVDGVLTIGELAFPGERFEFDRL